MSLLKMLGCLPLWLVLVVPPLALTYALARYAAARAFGLPIEQLRLGLGRVFFRRGVLEARLVPLWAKTILGETGGRRGARAAIALIGAVSIYLAPGPLIFLFAVTAWPITEETSGAPEVSEAPTHEAAATEESRSSFGVSIGEALWLALAYPVETTAMQIDGAVSAIGSSPTEPLMGPVAMVDTVYREEHDPLATLVMLVITVASPISTVGALLQLVPLWPFGLGAALFPRRRLGS